ncbi:MAG: DNA cytosine methyltransferase [Fusobacteriaceae bacterium]
MKVIDLFSGVGGISHGFRAAGFEIVAAVEKDKNIAYSYQMNHPETHVYNKDISEIEIERTFKKYKGDISVVVGGPPCQGFSQKGHRKSINDSRNFLFKYFVDVVAYLKPSYFLMENVPNLLTSEKGYFKDEIKELFEKIGYSLDIKILNASNFGVPQNRRRAFILGKIGDKPITLPDGNGKKTTIWEAISDLAFLESGEGENIQSYRIEIQSEYQKLMRKSSELYNHLATNHSEDAIRRLKLIPSEGGKESLPQKELTKSIYSGTWCRMKKDKVSVTVTTRFDTPSSGEFSHPYLNRAITVREAARLQSFPDSFIFYKTKTSQMKQVGNAVPPILAEEIAKVIKKDIY